MQAEQTSSQENINQEIRVLKTICESKELQILILSQIDEEFFGSEETLGIFKRIKSYIQNGKTVPVLSVLKNDQTLTESMRAIVSNKEGAFDAKDDVDRAISSLRSVKNKKILLNTILNIAQNQLGYSSDSILTALENTIQKCHSGQTQSDEMTHIDVKSFEKLVREAEEQLSEDINKDIIPTGFYEFDLKTGGLFRKNVLVMASVPGGGKSAMALQMAIHQYICGFNVCVVSYEMDKVEIKNRLYSNVSKVDHGDINLRKLDSTKKQLVLERYGKWIKSSKAENKITFFTPHRDMTISQIAMELKPFNYDVIYVDYLGLLYNNPKRALWENLGQHTRDAKMAANSLNALFILLAQLDDETNKLKYSKAIQANANMVWTWEYGDREKESGIIEVEQRKSRNSRTYPFYLETDFSILSFKSYSGPAPVYDEPENDRNDRNGNGNGKGRKKKRNAADAPASTYKQGVENPFTKTQTQPVRGSIPTMPLMRGMTDDTPEEKTVENLKLVNENEGNVEMGGKVIKLPNTPKTGIPKMPQLF